MILLRRLFLISVGLLVAGGLSIASSSTAAPLAAVPNQGSEIVVSALPGNEYSPDVAYNPIHDEYLVVWEIAWPVGHHEIYAQRVSGDGRLLSWFAVSSLPNMQMDPSVAYDYFGDRYLVVYTYDTSGNGSNWDIYGRVIPWSGPDVNLSDFPICDWPSNQRHPAVAYARTQNEFLVTWVNGLTGSSSIGARRVYTTGGFPGNAFTVSSETEECDFPDVAYNLARNEYLVTWDVLKGASNLDIYGTRLSATGAILTGGDPAVTGEFPIAGWPSIEQRPAAAACSLEDQYMVAWQSDQDTSGIDYAIYARYLNGTAAPGDVVMISDTSLPQINVDVACYIYGSKYLLAWQDKYVSGEYGIWARQAMINGSLEPEFMVAGPRSQKDREHPAVAAGRSTYLAVWEHDRDDVSIMDIHGRLLGFFNFLPAVRK